LRALMVAVVVDGEDWERRCEIQLRILFCVGWRATLVSTKRTLAWILLVELYFDGHVVQPFSGIKAVYPMSLSDNFILTTLLSLVTGLGQ
jgi:hypothetical protein